MSDIQKPIFPVTQRQGTHQCWAAVSAMMLGRRGEPQAVIDQVIVEARQNRVPIEVFGGGLREGGGPALAGAFKFFHVDLHGQVQNLDGNYFAGFLRIAPFGLFGLRPGYGLHAVAIYRLVGDFSSLSTTIAHGIDPMGGGHHFERSLFQMVMPGQPHAPMQSHFLLHRLV